MSETRHTMSLHPKSVHGRGCGMQAAVVLTPDVELDAWEESMEELPLTTDVEVLADGGYEVSYTTTQVPPPPHPCSSTGQWRV